MIKLSSENENVQIFLDYVHSRLRKYKIKLVLAIDQIKIGKNPVSGYFSDEGKELVVSIKDPEWLGILVHEFCHFLQYSEQDILYTSLDQGDSNYLTEVFGWIDGEYEFVSEKRKSTAFRKVLEMEHDCEKRSIELIKKFNLPIDLEEYIYSAYVYINFYNFSKKYRAWFSEGVSMSDIVEIKSLENIHKITLDKYFKKLPEEYVEIFKKYSRFSLDKQD